MAKHALRRRRTANVAETDETYRNTFDLFHAQPALPSSFVDVSTRFVVAFVTFVAFALIARIGRLLVLSLRCRFRGQVGRLLGLAPRRITRPAQLAHKQLIERQVEAIGVGQRISAQDEPKRRLVVGVIGEMDPATEQHVEHVSYPIEPAAPWQETLPNRAKFPQKYRNLVVLSPSKVGGQLLLEVLFVTRLNGHLRGIKFEANQAARALSQALTLSQHAQCVFTALLGKKPQRIGTQIGRSRGAGDGQRRAVTMAM